MRIVASANTFMLSSPAIIAPSADGVEQRPYALEPNSRFVLVPAHLPTGGVLWLVTAIPAAHTLLMRVSYRGL